MNGPLPRLSIAMTRNRPASGRVSVPISETS